MAEVFIGCIGCHTLISSGTSRDQVSVLRGRQRAVPPDEPMRPAVDTEAPCAAPEQTEQCPECDRTFKTKRGLGVHVRAKHPLLANANVKPASVKPRWGDEELKVMAEREAELILASCSMLNKTLLPTYAGVGQGR